MAGWMEGCLEAALDGGDRWMDSRAWMVGGVDGGERGGGLDGGLDGGSRAGWRGGWMEGMRRLDGGRG